MESELHRMISGVNLKPMPSNVNSTMNSGTLGRNGEFNTGKQTTAAPLKTPKVTKADITSDVN